MKKIIFTIVLLCLSGCGASSRVLFTDPETNSPIYEAQCNGTRLTIGDCLSEAASVCPNGFIPITSQENNVGSFSTANGNTTMNGFANGGFRNNGAFYANMNSYTNSNAYGITSAIIKRNIVFACKPILETKQSVKTVK